MRETGVSGSIESSTRPNLRCGATVPAWHRSLPAPGDGVAAMATVPAWFVTAARAGFDGDVLVLLDATGAETGRVERAR